MKKIVSVLCVLALLLTMLPGAVFAVEPDVTLTLDVKATVGTTTQTRDLDDLRAGDIVTAEVKIPQGVLLGGFQVKITFDKDKFEATTYTNDKGKQKDNIASLIGSAVDSDYTWDLTLGKAENANESGSVTTAAVCKEDGDPANSTTEKEAVLLQVKFKVKDTAAVGAASFTVDSSYTKVSYYPQGEYTAASYTVAVLDAQSVTIVQEISSVTVPAITAPVKNQTANIKLTDESSPFVARVDWSPALETGQIFAPGKAYTATIKVSPNDYYVWANSVTITYDGGSLNFTKDSDGNTYTSAPLVFPATAALDAPTVKTQPTATVTYGDAVSDSVITGGAMQYGDKDVEGTFKWAVTSYGDATATGETKNLKAVFTPNDQSNYATVDVDVKTTVNPKSLSGATIAEIADQTYNSKEIKPEPAVTLGGVTLVKGTDFTYSYENNTNAGTATVKINGTGNYKDKASKDFAIQKRTVTDLSFRLGKSTIKYGTAVGCSLSGGAGATKTIYYQKDGGAKTAYDTDTTDRLDVGTYYFWAEIAETANDNAVSTESNKQTLVVEPMPMTTAKVFDITVADATYTGSALEPALTIKDGNFTDKTLVKDTDYTVTYENNVNAGTATAKITGQGNYKDTVEKTFTISPKSITATVDEITGSFTYSGDEQKPDVTVKDGTTTLVKGTDYTVSYENNVNAGTNTAKAIVKAKKDGNYNFDDVTKTFTISKATALALSAGENKMFAVCNTYQTEKQTCTFSLANITPSLTNAIVTGATVKTENFCDSVSYANGTFTFNGVAPHAEGTVNIELEITSQNYENMTVTIPVNFVSAKQVTLTLANWSTVYGEEIVVGTIGNELTNPTGTYTVTYSKDGSAVESPRDAGEYAVKVTYQDTVQEGVFPGHYGETTATLTINKKALTATISHDTITYGDPAPTDGYTVEFTGLVGTDVLTASDYTLNVVAYSAGSNAGEYDYTLELKETVTNYELELYSGALIVKAKALTETMVADITGSFTYSGDEQKPDVTVTDGTTPLVKDTDYTVSYENNVNAGTAKAKITGKGNYTGMVEKTFTIDQKSIETASVGMTLPIYDGTAKEPAPTVKFGEKTLTKGTDYTVSYENNINAGMNTAKVKITGTGNYTGEQEVNFSINKRGICIQAENKSSRVGEAQKELTWMFGDDNKNALVAGHTVDPTSITLTLSPAFDNSKEGTFTINVDISKIKITDSEGTDVTANYTVGQQVGTYTVSNKLVPTVTADDIDVTYTGSDVPITAANPTATYDGSAVDGTWIWKDETPKDVVDTTYTLVFKPTDSVNYASNEVTIHVTVRKANPSGTPGFTVLDTDGKTLADAKLNVGTISPAGTIAWELPESTKVESDKAYTWIFTPTDTDNYNTLTGTIVVYSAEPDVPEERTIRVNSPKHGELIVKPRAAKPGTEVNVYAEGDEGYTLDELYVLDSRGNEIKLTRKGGKYTFIMPERDVTVYASFKAEQQINPFDDVSRNDYFYDAVLWAVENEVTSGTGASTFSPDDACTRAQTVTFMWRAAGSPSVRGVENPFTDVKRSDYFYEAVLWAVQEGITTGTSATTFSPDATVTRGQVATFLYRLADSGKRTYAHPFTDVTAGSYNDNAIGWAYANEITTGTTKTTFGPDEACSRAQIVTFLYRYYGLAF